MRLIQQQAIMGKLGPELTVVIGEAALRRAVGGAEVMHEQLQWLAEGKRGPYLGQSSGAPAAVGGAHRDGGQILRFAGAAELGVVHLPFPSADLSIVEPADVAIDVAAFEQLKAAALDPSASAQMLRNLAGQAPA